MGQDRSKITHGVDFKRESEMLVNKRTQTFIDLRAGNN